MKDYERKRDVGERTVQLANCVLVIAAITARYEIAPIAAFLLVRICGHQQQGSGISEWSLAARPVSHKAGANSRGKREQQQNHHRTAGRTVAKTTAGAAAQKIEEIPGRGHRPIEEIPKARPRRPNETPQHAQADDDPDEVSGPNVEQFRPAPFFLCRDLRDGEGGNEQPMPVAHDRVPDDDTRRGLDLLYIRHSQSSVRAISRGPTASALI